MQKQEIEVGPFVGFQMRESGIALEFEQATIILTHEAWAAVLSVLES